MQPANWLKIMARHVYNHPDFWRKCSRIETHIVQDALKPVKAPIYVCGLARSGSTLLLETLNQHPHTHSFTYEDFPFIYIPWFWSHITKNSPAGTKEERTHKDRILINPKSPEAMEELLWMHGFKHTHHPEQIHLLDENTQNPSFAKDYIHIIQKLLYAQHAQRYLAKANYHVARIPYLLKLFPDARFIIPIRHPIHHIASLLKQHRLLTQEQKKDAYAIEHLKHTGHFEFGLDRRPINITDTTNGAATIKAWEAHKDTEGYALQWAHIYSYLLDLSKSKAHKKAILLVPFERLYSTPVETLSNVFHHANLPDTKTIIDRAAASISKPTYYQPSFSAKEIIRIKKITEKTANQLDYTFQEYL